MEVTKKVIELTLLEISVVYKEFSPLKMVMIALTTSFSMLGPEDLVKDVGLIFNLSESPSTLHVCSVLTEK